MGILFRGDDDDETGYSPRKVDDDLLKMVLLDYQGEGAVKVIAALRKKEMTDRPGSNDAPYADWLFKNLEEILNDK